MLSMPEKWFHKIITFSVFVLVGKNLLQKLEPKSFNKSISAFFPTSFQETERQECKSQH